MIKAIAMIYICAVVAVAVQECEEKFWRGHAVLCCYNGSAIKRKFDQWIWVEQRPIICGRIERKDATKQLSVASLLAIIFGTIACVACHIYYAMAYFFYRLFRSQW